MSTDVIVEQAEDGRVSIADGEDNSLGAGRLGGSVIGMLIGALGGPIGLLLGWDAATGARARPRTRAPRTTPFCPASPAW